jgi:mono/diheme cytochrome c family protein
MSPRSASRALGVAFATLVVAGAASAGAALADSTPAQPPTPAVSEDGRDPTFARDVAPILYKNCTVCHHVGGSGPFPLFDYDSAMAYKAELTEKVTRRRMPPWHEVGPRGVFRNDRRLSEVDRSTILRWLETGAKPGDLRKLPPKPVYPKEMWSIGKPDVILAMPTEYEVAARGTIEYQDFQVPTNFTEDTWIQAYEIMPGAREVVHHVQVYAKAPADPAGTPAVRPVLVRNMSHVPPREAASKPSGLLAFFKREPAKPVKVKKPRRDFGVLIASMAPGTNPIEFPAGTALRVKAGTVLTFQMHYTAHGRHKMKDRTRIGFRLAKQPPEEEIYASAFVNEVFSLPAGAKNIPVPSEIGTREPIKVWGLLPHTHVRGARWLYKLHKPGTAPQVILDIPEYDFNWQIYYLWKRPIEIPAGGKITAMAWYDNSKDNEFNPDPTKIVEPGEQTWEEMQYTGMLYSVPSRRLRTAAR